MSGLEQARLGLTCVGKGPTLESEELRLDQVFRNRRAIDLDPGHVPPDAGLVQDPHQQALAGSRLAEDEDGWKTCGGTLAGQKSLHLCADRNNSGAAADQQVERAHRARIVVDST